MRSVLFAYLVSIAFAAPNGGYNYVTPNYNYVSPATAQHIHHHHHGSTQQHQHQQHSSFGGLTSPSVQQFISNHASGFQSAPSNLASHSNYNSGFNTAPAFPVFNQYSQQSNNLRPHNSQRQVLPTLVTKHIYIHSAPEESEEEIYDDHSVHQERKHFNIVFIKVPSQTARKTALSVAQALNEEKTVIYVLSKKNDVSEIKEALQNVPHRPQKPEVFFIKYKTPEEAHHAQKTIQAQYDALGGTTKISDEGFAPVSSVIGTLGNVGNSFPNGGFIGNGAAAESGSDQLISSGSGISLINGNGYNSISSGSGNLLVGGSYLPPNKVKKA